MSHLDEGQLHELLDGELDESARAAALAHLAGCERCRAAYDEAKSFLAEADALIDAVQVGEVAGRGSPVASRESPAGRDVRRTRRLTTYRTLAWAASLVLAVGLGWYGSRMRPGAPDAAPSEASRVAATAGDAVAPAVSEQQAEVTPPVAQPQPALPGADKALARQVPAPPTTPAAPTESTEEKAGADEVLAAAANQAPLPSPEPVATAPGASVSGMMARKIAPMPEQMAPQAASAPRAARAKERDASSAFAGADTPAGFYAIRPYVTGLRPIAMEEAVRILGGSIRLIDGLTPTRILGGGGSDKDGTSRVRVVYEDPPGRELWLDQQRVASMADMRAEAVTALLPGDSTEVVGADGARSLHWVDQSGFQLALTGFLPADSLRQILRRVQ